jgi:hypothetical protein
MFIYYHVRLFLANNILKGDDSMTRDDMFDEATCALDKMISLTTIVVDFFDFPELTREQLSDIQSRSKEICDIIFSVRDYITRLQEIIETLSKEDKPQKKEMSTEYFHNTT